MEKHREWEKVRSALWPVKCPNCSAAHRPQIKTCSFCGHPMDQPVERISLWEFQRVAFKNSVDSTANSLGNSA